MLGQEDPKKTQAPAATVRPPMPPRQRELVRLSLLLCPRSEEEPRR